MSNDNSNKVNFWTTVPGIIAGIAALLTAVTGLVTAWNTIQSSSKTPSSTSENQQPLTTESHKLILKSGNDKSDGSFNVPANLQQGFEVQNSGNRPLKIDLTAKGKWLYAPGTPLNPPEGLPSQKSGQENYRLPQAAQGSLIIRREDNTYEYVGKEGEISLTPQERVSFTINDTRDEKSYLDNQGEIKVFWSCDNCTSKNN
ncbi:hypothetical protein [Nostoc sp.]|uniref:hypothetical protein n=1 Tax=Nostoc sp. TaxID=1180 RepID=UPI002FF630C9